MVSLDFHIIFIFGQCKYIYLYISYTIKIVCLFDLNLNRFYQMVLIGDRMIVLNPGYMAMH